MKAVSVADVSSSIFIGVFYWFTLQQTVLSDTSITRQEILLTMLNDSKYDPSIKPNFERDNATQVAVQLSIRDMHSISEVSMEYSVDLLLRQWWNDDRLDYSKWNTTEQKLELDTKTMNKVWVPDTYFSNERRASIHSVTTTNKLMHIYKDGTIVYSMRVALTLSCKMLLHKYPFDSQVCPIVMKSFGYSDSYIDLNWRQSRAIILKAIEMPQFSLSEEVTLEDFTENYETGRWAILKVELSLKRKIGFYFLQVFIPSIFLVVLSWLSFWVDASAVPARVSLGVTCVLTMTTQSSGIRQTLPPVSYAKAIDVWMFVCLLFVFAALLEFAYVNVVGRRKPDEGLKKEDNQLKEKDVDYLAKRVDLVSRVAFPSVFIIFCIIFAIVCIFSPDSIFIG